MRAARLQTESCRYLCCLLVATTQAQTSLLSEWLRRTSAAAQFSALPHRNTLSPVAHSLAGALPPGLRERRKQCLYLQLPLHHTDALRVRVVV